MTDTIVSTPVYPRLSNTAAIAPPSAKLIICHADGSEGATFEFSNDIYIGR